MRFTTRPLSIPIAITALLSTLVGVPTAATADEDTDRRMYTGAVDRTEHHGSIDGAEYRVEVPDSWNGTLVLFSHGFYPPEWAPDHIELAGRPETAQWLLDRGYALAASRFKSDGRGYVVEDGFDDQLALLDWFSENVGEPRRTISTGYSQGATIASLLAERAPHRFDGLMTMCGEYDTAGTWNTALDISFVVKTLLARGKDIDLVKADDPATSTQALVDAVTEARKTKLGRARLALVGAVANLPTWYAAHEQEPTGLRERINAQSLWVQWAYLSGLGPSGRVDLEERAGGNPSWNVGINYTRQLARSSQKSLVRKAYRAAGANPFRDLRRLARAPRIRPDGRALAYQYRHGVASGRMKKPIVTLHSTGDGGAITDQERWYAKQVRRRGEPDNLRQLWIERGAHCSFSPADEIVTLRSLLQRVESGTWPNLSPRRLDARVSRFAAPLQTVMDIGTGETQPMPPAFTRFSPPRFLRPSY